VPVRFQSFVNEYKTKRNKIDVLWEDIEQASEVYRAGSRRI